MGKASVKEHKNIYQLCREETGLTRAKAAEKLYLSASRIEKIENGARPHADEVLKMAEGYGAPELCNDFCCSICEIGRQRNIPRAESKELSQITLEMLSTINVLSKEKDRLIEISVDGKITKDEVGEFQEIRQQLNRMTAIIESLQLWVEKSIEGGESDPSLRQ